MPLLWGLMAEPLLVVVGGLIFCLLANSLVRALAPESKGALGFVLNATSAPLKLVTALSSKIIDRMARQAVGPQARVGGALHETARLVEHVAGAIEAQSQLAVLIAQETAGGITEAELHKQIGQLTARVGNTEAQARGIGNDVRGRIADVSAGIGHDVLPQLRSLDRELARIETRTIPRLGARVHSAEEAIANLREWVRRHTVVAATTAFAGAVAIALAKIGGGWIRCGNWNRIGRAVCGLPVSLIESLLSDAIEAFIVADLCDFVAGAAAVAKAIEPALIAFVDLEDVLIGCHGATAPGPLGLRAVALPQPVAPLALAA